MSERMTDAEFERNASGERPHPSDEQDMMDEARRARSEEAQLTKEAAEKDAQIKALADALAGILKEEPNIYEGRLEASLYVSVDALEAAQSALRLAGRLP